MEHNKNCRLCGKSLPKWWEDVFLWGKDIHRKQCRHCGKCTSGIIDIWGRCEMCRENDWEEKKIQKEEAINDSEESVRLVQEVRELELRQAKEAEINQYRVLRKEIEAMPQYQQWRQAVLEKFGKRCAVCGLTQNIEIDHRYESFYAIVRRYGITNTIQAYECSALWNVNNGAPLCKLHHDQTKSSIYHKIAI